VPGLAVGGGVFVEVASARAGLLAPSFRLSLLASSTQSLFTSVVGANLLWGFVRAEACPARLRGPAALSATLCADIDAGVLASEGVGLPNVVSDTRAWVVPGGLARLTWAASDGVFLEGTAGFGVLLARYSFSYQPGGMPGTIDVWRMPLVDAEFGLGAGYRFR
jgi:hypothetical protein